MYSVGVEGSDSAEKTEREVEGDLCLPFASLLQRIGPNIPSETQGYGNVEAEEAKSNGEDAITRRGGEGDERPGTTGNKRNLPRPFYLFGARSTVFLTRSQIENGSAVSSS